MSVVPIPSPRAPSSTTTGGETPHRTRPMNNRRDVHRDRAKQLLGTGADGDEHAIARFNKARQPGLRSLQRQLVTEQPEQPHYLRCVGQHRLAYFNRWVWHGISTSIFGRPRRHVNGCEPPVRCRFF